MANLKYKTRGNSSPQGKPRVYFCCHPLDFNNYFETVSDEILAKHNCAIWYTDEELERNDDFFADLNQMQLFIMPVTTNLLYNENETLDIEFKFAIENHIPVLPLIQEGGLEELFNKKCGALQFLDKNNKDITAINYDKKLQKYLDSVLISDELAEKIRAAFDAYVFLSYRKKDRKYAQELMRLIHKNEFCRDIAIWYDEFLTPGENFNDSIKEALQKSDLFVLAVTPNLINESNYIMTTEYPMAKQQGKTILPAELVHTDKNELAKKYEDIPNPTDVYNEAKFSEVLLETMKQIAIKENDGSLEHNFFIGLAYLSGVDVEVDYERAKSLILGAAEAGLIEAIKKMVVMYSTGLGVDCNWSEALAWQEKAVDYYKHKYLIEKNFNNGLAYYEQLDSMVEILYSYNNSFVAESSSTLSHSVTPKDLGEFCFNKIHNTLLECKKVSLDLYESEHKVKPYMLLIDSIDKLSQFHENIGEITTALEYAELNLLFYQSYISQSKSETFEFLLILINLRRGRLLKLKGEFEKGKEILEIIPAFYDALDNKIREIISKAYLIDIYIELGDINKHLENFFIAEKNYLSSIEIIQEYYKYDRGYTISYCTSLHKLSSLYLNMQNINQAKKLLDKGIEILTNFEKKHPNIETSECLAKLYESYGDLCKQTGTFGSASDYYNQAYLIRWKALDDRFEMRTCIPMAILYRKMGENGKDISMIELALDIFEEACDTYPEINVIQEERKNTKYILEKLTTNEN